jgi:Flp pilus assembly pilin Flp
MSACFRWVTIMSLRSLGETAPRNMLARGALDLFRREDGQDLVEYGLLGLFVGLAGLAAWNAIAAAIGTSYAGYDSGVQGLWEPRDP